MEGKKWVRKRLRSSHCPSGSTNPGKWDGGGGIGPQGDPPKGSFHGYLPVSRPKGGGGRPKKETRERQAGGLTPTSCCLPPTSQVTRARHKKVEKKPTRSVLVPLITRKKALGKRRQDPNMRVRGKVKRSTGCLRIPGSCRPRTEKSNGSVIDFLRSTPF